jgi:mono/diheme cytochrome c family protein
VNGDDGEQQSPPSLWLVLALPVSLVITVFALGFGLIIAIGLEEGGEATPTTTTQPSANEEGEQLFISQACGSCHTLSAAGATGTVGPNLDETQLSETEIAAVVSHGRGTAMPAFSDRLSPAEIAAIAAYVSASLASSP